MAISALLPNSDKGLGFPPSIASSAIPSASSTLTPIRQSTKVYQYLHHLHTDEVQTIAANMPPASTEPRLARYSAAGTTAWVCSLRLIKLLNGI